MEKQSSGEFVSAKAAAGPQDAAVQEPGSAQKFLCVEDLLAERGLDVSYESLRRWVLKFGPLVARELRRMRYRPTSRWHLDEMGVLIGGKQFWPWRAVDDEGEVLDRLVQRRRDRNGAVKLMAKTAQETGLRARRSGDRQAAFLRRSKGGAGTINSPRTGVAQEQSGREFASARATTRAQDAAL
jgi:DDE domain